MIDEGSFTIETTLDEYTDAFVDDSPASPMRSYMLMNLAPMQAYEVQIFARNSIGWSEPSAEFVFVTSAGKDQWPYKD